MAIRVRIETHELEAEPGLSLFECAERLGLSVTNSCGKQGKCRECLVEVTSGSELLTPAAEQEHHLRGRFRLACRARISADSGVIACRRLRRSGMRILEAADKLPDRQRPESLDPAVTRSGDAVQLDGTSIAHSLGPLYGLALDLGTTTVVVRLVDLDSGAVRATHSFENPQRFAGSDIMARIAHQATDRDNRLQRSLVAYVNQTIAELPCSATSIYEVVVAGNSTMRDLFFGLDVQSLGQSPYRSQSEHDLLAGRRSTTSLSAPARKLGLRVHRSARAYGLPLVGGHVGADAAACLLAIDAANEDRLVALMDIGTNTELILGTHNRMLAASCPAGPAFEGGSLSCGMPAFPGAIEAVRLNGHGTPAYTVIGGGPPEGICGSGLVDVLSELLRCARMNTLGRISGGRLVIDQGADLQINDEDVSLLAQAKAAQAAGWTLVMKRYGAEYTDLERLYLTGGFANHIDPNAAIRIGLIPPLAPDRIYQVGNAAIEGATLALLSVKLRRGIESFVRGIEHVELETDEGFFDAFVEGCQFKPLADAEQHR